MECFYLLSRLAHADTGINIRQLLRDNANLADPVARRMFRTRTGKKVFAAIERCLHSKIARKDSKSTEDRKQLKQIVVTVLGIVLMALFTSGAVLNVTSTQLCNRLNYPPLSTNRRMRTDDGTETEIFGEVIKVAVTVQHLTHQKTFMVVNSAAVSSIVGRPTMKE